MIRAEVRKSFRPLRETPLLIPSLAAEGALRGFRVGRAWRSTVILARVVAIGARPPGRAPLGAAPPRRRLHDRLAALTSLTAAVAFTLVEDVGEGQRLDSFFDRCGGRRRLWRCVPGHGTWPGRRGCHDGRCISAFAIVTAKIAGFLVLTHEEDERAGSP